MGLIEDARTLLTNLGYKLGELGDEAHEQFLVGVAAAVVNTSKRMAEAANDLRGLAEQAIAVAESLQSGGTSSIGRTMLAATDLMRATAEYELGVKNLSQAIDFARKGAANR